MLTVLRVTVSDHSEVTYVLLLRMGQVAGMLP